MCRGIVAAIVLGSLLALSGAPARAAERPWIKLQTPRFGVVSQLNEQATRRWALEFEQFIDALHLLFGAQQRELPPLTVVLFDRPRDFAPYRMHTPSGQVEEIAGFFSNTGTWSVIGLNASGATAATRRTIYHEAVHWFSSAGAVASPLWFEEGMAEVLSTFSIRGGRGRWGEVLQNNIDYLNQARLRPLDEFLRITQDQAMHGMDSYYPQAWAFVHYLLFGNNGARRDQLQAFLVQLRSTDLETAFATAFGASMDEVTEDLRGYLRGGRYGLAEVALPDHGAELSVGPASALNVEFALARLALAGGNDALAAEHIARVVSGAPNQAAGHELQAMLAQRAGDHAAMQAALQRAMALGSTDAGVYTLNAALLLELNQREGAAVTGLIPPEIARAMLDSLGRAIALQPRNRRPYELLVTALLNAHDITRQDEALVGVGRQVFPVDGTLLVGQAAIERQRDGLAQARALLRQALAEPFTLPGGFRQLVRGLHDGWLLDWLSAETARLVDAGAFGQARGLLDAELADTTLGAALRRALESMRRELLGFERLAQAQAAVAAGEFERARGILHSLAGDQQAGPSARRAARTAIERLPAE